MSVALTVMVASFRDGVTQWLASVLPADLYARSAGSGASAEQAWLPPDFAQKAAAVPGVERVLASRTRALQMAPDRPAVSLIARELASPQDALPLLEAPLPPAVVYGRDMLQARLDPWTQMAVLQASGAADRFGQRFNAHNAQHYQARMQELGANAWLLRPMLDLLNVLLMVALIYGFAAQTPTGGAALGGVGLAGLALAALRGYCGDALDFERHSASANGLTPLGQNLYIETASSGAPQVGVPGTTALGTLKQGFVETSNVNVVEELVQMIQTQRAYELNSKAITTSDQMLQRLGQL
jgi:hypothetical protein